MLPFSLYKVRLSWCPNYLTGCILLPLHLLHPSFKAFLVCFYLKHAEESRVSCSRSCWKGVWCVIGCWVTAGAWQTQLSLPPRPELPALGPWGPMLSGGQRLHGAPVCGASRCPSAGPAAARRGRVPCCRPPWTCSGKGGDFSLQGLTLQPLSLALKVT